VHAVELMGLDVPLDHSGALLVSVVGVLDAGGGRGAVHTLEVGNGVVGAPAPAGDVAESATRIGCEERP